MESDKGSVVWMSVKSFTYIHFMEDNFSEKPSSESHGDWTDIVASQSCFDK